MMRDKYGLISYCLFPLVQVSSDLFWLVCLICAWLWSPAWFVGFSLPVVEIVFYTRVHTYFLKFYS